MVVAVMWILAVAVGTFVGSSKNRALLGFILSLLFSWVGVIIMLAVPKRRILSVTQNAVHQVTVVNPTQEKEHDNNE